MLFELLTQETPLAQAISHERPIDESLRVVRLQQPVRPSDRLRHMRGERQVKGELDAICVKAMASEPQHRYQTVAALMRDIENFLYGRPVGARKISIWDTIFKRTSGCCGAASSIALIGCLLLGGASNCRRVAGHRRDFVSQPVLASVGDATKGRCLFLSAGSRN
jgi:eukaryotic-like serine/threonine-protein kinase